MKYLLIIMFFGVIGTKAQAVNKRDSFYLYRIRANAYADSVEMFRKSKGPMWQYYCRKRREVFIKQKYWEEKFYSN